MNNQVIRSSPLSSNTEVESAPLPAIQEEDEQECVEIQMPEVTVVLLLSSMIVMMSPSPLTPILLHFNNEKCHLQSNLRVHSNWT